MTPDSFYKRGAPSRHGSQWNASALIVGIGASSSSARHRNDLDFGQLPQPASRPGQPSGLRKAYRRFRGAAGPSEHAQAANEQPLLGGAQARVSLRSGIRKVSPRDQDLALDDVGLRARVRFASRLGDINQHAGHRPAAGEQQGQSSWFPRLARIGLRTSALSPSAQASPPAANMSPLEGGRPMTPAEANLRRMRAALVHAMPALKQAQDDETHARIKSLAGRMAALEIIMTDAGEHGFSIDRVLTALRENAGGADVTDALAFAQRLIGELTDCLTTDAVKGKPSRRGLILAGLRLAMPHLSDGTHPRAPAEAINPANATEMLLHGLLKLDKCFAGRPGYAFDRLFAVLCNHARIVEFSRARSTTDRAVSGLLAMTDWVNDAIASDRDGYALNALIGIDPDLDDAIVDLRTRMVERFMDAHAVWVDAAGKPKCAQVLTKDAEDLVRDAGELVKLETDLARARMRLEQAFMRAFRHAEIDFPVEVLRGTRMDAAMVNGLVKQLERKGRHAKDVGLAIMAVHLLEQEVAGSNGGQRVRQCLTWDLASSRERIKIGEDKVILLKQLATRMAAKGALPDLLKQIDALDANLKEDRARVRRLEPREKSLADPGPISPELTEKLGLTGMSNRHIVQLGRQGLSSAQEAYGALAFIQKSMDNWLADDGLVRMKKFGLLDVLLTKRQEQRSELAGKALLEMHRRHVQGGWLVTANGEDPVLVRKALVRAAILRLVPIEQASRGKKGMPVLGSFQPKISAVRGQLVKWGLDEDLTADIEAEIGKIGDGLTMKKIAGWLQEAALLPDPALKEPAHQANAQTRLSRFLKKIQRPIQDALPKSAEEAAIALRQKEDELKGYAADLRARLEKLLPRKSNNVNQIEFLAEGDLPDQLSNRLSNQLNLRDAVRMVLLEHLAHDFFAAPDTQAVLAALEQQGVRGAEAMLSEQTATPMTPEKLATWQKETQARELRKDMVDSLVDVRIGTRAACLGHQQLKLASGMFGDAVGISGRVSLGRMTGVDFGNPGDPGGSMENVFRASVDTKLGIDIRVPVIGRTRIMGIKIGPMLSADASGQRVKAVVVRCKDAASQQALTRKLLQRSDPAFDKKTSRITFDDLANADDLMFMVEDQASVEAGAGMYATLQPGDVEFDAGSAHNVRPGLAARVMGSGVWQGLRYIAQNNNARIERLETIKTARRSALLQAGGAMRADEEAQSNVSGQFLEAGVRQDNEVRDRIRTLERRGRVVDAETFSQGFVAGETAVELVKKLGGPGFAGFMELLGQDPETHALYEEINALTADIRTNELASVARQLDPTAGFYAGNALLDQSNAVRSHRIHNGGIREDHASAQAIRGRARQVFHDRSLYNVARVAAIPVRFETQSITLLMGLLEKKRVMRGESLPVEIKLYAPALLALATQARKDLQYGVSQGPLDE